MNKKNPTVRSSSRDQLRRKNIPRVFETGGLALLPKMDGVVGKGCVEDAKIDAFVAAMNHTFLLFPPTAKDTQQEERDIVVA